MCVRRKLIYTEFEAPMLKRFFLIFILFVLFTRWAHGALSIQIVDAPSTQLLIYSPIFVTAVVRNEGSDDVFLPESSLGFEISDPNGHLALPGPGGDLLHDEIAWLKPGEKYLFQEDLSGRLETTGWSEGIYEVRALVRASGETVLIDKDVKDFPIRRLRKHEGITSFYACWKGSEQSDYVKVSINKSQDPIDEEVLDYILSQKFPATTLNGQFYRSYDYLVKNYPMNFYTFVAAFRRGYFDQVLTLQPNNQLVPYARTTWALQQIYGAKVNGGVQGAKDEAKRLPSMELPKVLKDYVLQQMNRPMHDHTKS
jgi:hypothetical protein